MGGEGGNATDVVGRGGVGSYARTAVIRSTYSWFPRRCTGAIRRMPSRSFFANRFGSALSNTRQKTIRVNYALVADEGIEERCIPQLISISTDLSDHFHTPREISQSNHSLPAFYISTSRKINNNGLASILEQYQAVKAAELVIPGHNHRRQLVDPANRAVRR